MGWCLTHSVNPPTILVLHQLVQEALGIRYHMMIFISTIICIWEYRPELMPKKDTVFSCCIIDIPYIPKYSVSFYDNFYAKNKGSHYTELIFLKKLKKKKILHFWWSIALYTIKRFSAKKFTGCTIHEVSLYRIIYSNYYFCTCAYIDLYICAFSVTHHVLE